MNKGNPPQKNNQKKDHWRYFPVEVESHVSAAIRSWVMHSWIIMGRLSAL